ncbi:MAG: signal peptidase II [Pseudomonadota bacterium]
MTQTGLRFFGLVTAAVVLIADQLVKWWMLVGVFGLEGPIRAGTFAPQTRVTDFFNLTLVWNDGISFGLLGGEDAVWMLSGLAILVSLVLLVWLWRANGRLLVLSLGLIIGGALGNVVDRLRFGAVADFLDFHVMGYHFFVFNVADAAISIGVVLIVVDSFFAGARTNRDAGQAIPGTHSGEGDRD